MTMRFLTLKQYQEKYFTEGSAPCAATVRKWIKKKEILGKQVNGNYYINEDAWVAQMNGDDSWRQMQEEDLSKDDLLLLDEITDIKRNQ